MKAFHVRPFFDVLLMTLCISTPAVLANPIDFAVGDGNVVTWGGDSTDRNPLTEKVPPHGSLQFFWTIGYARIDDQIKPITSPDYAPFENLNFTDVPQQYTIRRPNNDTIQDWLQILTDAKGTSNVHYGNIKRGSPWMFSPLGELSGSYFRIPDLAPREAELSLTIYTAVNAPLYLARNPFGFLDGNYTEEQTIDELGIQIINGQIPGLEGIYFSTTEFLFDPDSATGYVPSGGPSSLLNSADFQARYGTIGIIGIHQTPVPEPPRLLLISIGLAGVALKIHERRQATRA